MLRFLVAKPNETVEVLLLPHKNTNKYSFVNITKGHICSCASKMLANYKAPYTATVVTKLLKEGAIIVGRTNMTFLFLRDWKNIILDIVYCQLTPRDIYMSIMIQIPIDASRYCQNRIAFNTRLAVFRCDNKIIWLLAVSC